MLDALDVGAGRTTPHSGFELCELGVIAACNHFDVTVAGVLYPA